VFLLSQKPRNTISVDGQRAITKHADHISYCSLSFSVQCAVLRRRRLESVGGEEGGTKLGREEEHFRFLS